MIIAIDFDDTLCDANNNAVPSSFDWLRKYQQAGVKLILWTCRGGKWLEEAVDFCLDRGIVFWEINKNSQMVFGSPKIVADIYIDDRAFGAPKKDGVLDWDIVGPEVMKRIENEK